MWLTYGIIAAILVIAELVYFKIADHFNIIDKPNERSSHTKVVLRGGGVIFSISIVIWMIWQMMNGSWVTVHEYLPFVCGLMLIAGVSFVDDIHSLPDSLRMVVQTIAILLMFWSIGLMHWNMWWIIPIAMFFCMGAANFINFMDGINGITAGCSFAMLVPLLVKNEELRINSSEGFIDGSLLIVAIIGVLVFSIFNFRPKGKAKCFAGDVGSMGIAFIILFALGRLMMMTGDITYIVFFLVYGIDANMTLCHRVLLHENLGQAHRKHAYQLMANELKMSHVVVSLMYMVAQLALSFGFIFLCPDTILAHWIYFAVVFMVLVLIYVLFMRKYFHLHEEYLASLNKG